MTQEDSMTTSPARSIAHAIAEPILGLVLLAFLVGCGLRGGPAGDPFRDQERNGMITLEIRNDNFNDARIHALWNGERHRLGTVTGISERSFDIDFRMGDLRVHVDFLAAGEFTTERILASPGDTVRLVIPSRP